MFRVRTGASAWLLLVREALQNTAAQQKTEKNRQTSTAAFCDTTVSYESRGRWCGRAPPPQGSSVEVRSGRTWDGKTSDHGSAAIAGNTSRLGPGPPRQNHRPSPLRTELGGKRPRLRRDRERKRWRGGFGAHAEASLRCCSKDLSHQSVFTLS